MDALPRMCGAVEPRITPGAAKKLRPRHFRKFKSKNIARSQCTSYKMLI